MPQVSIITINLNNKAGLEKTIQSVIAQTYNDFEFIVVDGGSRDGSAELLNRYQEKITYGISEKDSGIYNAMNKGIKIAKGDYCLFLNSGDYFTDNNVLNRVFKSDYSEEILYGDMLINSHGKQTYGKHPEKITFDFMVLTTLWHPVSFIKRSGFDKYGYFNEYLKIVSDYEFFIKTIIINQVSTRHLAFPIAVFNTDGIGSSSEYQSLHETERKDVLEKYFSKPVIEAAYQFNLLKKSRAVLFANWLKQHPFIYNIASAFYNILNRLRKFLNF